MGSNEKEVFDGCSSLTTVNVGNNVNTIPDYAFNNCESLTTLNLGNSVESIGICAFASCKNLESLDIPESVETIGNYAFTHCLGLKTTTINKAPKDMTIGDYAFYNNQSILINYSDQDLQPRTAGYGGLMNSMDVIVKVATNELYLRGGEPTPFVTVIVYDNPTGIPTLTWSSGDNDIATVDPDVEIGTSEKTYTGYITGWTVGSTTITLTCTDVNAQTTATATIPCSVRVSSPSPTPKPTAIDELFVDEDGQTVEVYTLQGVKVGNTNLAPGVYVRRAGDKAEKIFVR